MGKKGAMKEKHDSKKQGWDSTWPNKTGKETQALNSDTRKQDKTKGWNIPEPQVEEQDDGRMSLDEYRALRRAAKAEREAESEPVASGRFAMLTSGCLVSVAHEEPERVAREPVAPTKSQRSAKKRVLCSWS